MHTHFGWSDEIPRSFYTDFDAVKNALTYHNCKTILDLGCGNGVLVDALIRSGYDAYGVDSSEEGIIVANQRAPRRFFLCDVDSMTLPKELQEVSFDAIVSTQVIEHLYSPHNYIDFCYSILPLGGVLVITTPYHGWLKNVCIALSGQFDHHATSLMDGGHIKFFSHKTITRLVEGHGFSVLHFEGMGRIPFLWRSMLVSAQKQ